MTARVSPGTALLPRLISYAGSPELRTLFRSAVQGEGALRASDLLLVRDLSELTGETHPAFQALLLCLLVARDEGSLCVGLEEASLTRRLSLLAGPDAGTEWARKMLDSIGSWPGHARIFATSDDAYLPLVLVDTPRGPYVYFHRYWAHARTLREQVTERMTRQTSLADGATIEAVANEVARTGDRELNPEQLAAVRLALQRPFVVVSGGPGTGKTSIVVSILRGLVRLGCTPDRMRLAAPTGRAGHRMTEAVLAGLPGLAEPEAQLRQITGTTIHRLLGYNPASGTFRYGAGNRLPISAVIVDEVSMVDVALMSRLLGAVPDDARVILLGDKDQLPSVEAGAVLADLMPAEPVAARGAVVLLTRNYRSQRHIQETAAKVNAVSGDPAALVASLPRFPLEPGGDWPPDPLPDGEEPPGGCFLLDADGHDLRTWHAVLDTWARAHYGPESDHLPSVPSARPHLRSLAAPVTTPSPLAEWGKGRRPGGEVGTGAGSLAGKAETQRDLRPRAYAHLVREFGRSSSWEDLELSGEGVLGELFRGVARARVLTLVRGGAHGCEGLNDYLCRQIAPLDPSGTPRAFSGMPLLVARNDPSTGLYNGDVGIVLRGRRGGLRAVFRRLGRYVAHPLDALPPWEPAFAMTVHKSQGSEYGRVLVVLPPQGGRRLLSKEMIYTAITRARDLAVIYARPEVLAEALANRVERDTGISSLGSA